MYFCLSKTIKTFLKLWLAKGILIDCSTGQSTMGRNLTNTNSAPRKREGHKYKLEEEWLQESHCKKAAALQSKSSSPSRKDVWVLVSSRLDTGQQWVSSVSPEGKTHGLHQTLHDQLGKRGDCPTVLSVGLPEALCAILGPTIWEGCGNP